MTTPSIRGQGGTAVGKENLALSEINPNMTDVFFDSEDEDYPSAVPNKSKRHFTVGDEGNEQHLSDSDDDATKGCKRLTNPDNASGKSTGKGSKLKQKQRRRRRSSARFLRLSGRFGPDAEIDEIQGGNKAKENLGEVYRQAIQMNAENKINAGNSWGLRLIENMDKFTYEDDDVGRSNLHENEIVEGGSTKVKRINFTKASCTLDASVKIYGYRVDDVHLTSYKVLANLNRTDNGGSGKKNNQICLGMDGDEMSAVTAVKKVNARTGPTETLESNLANINMSKLESAPDIDPLFRKMSKAFDEGGAKGLLLNNLGIASDGCRIEFDSKDDSVADNSSTKVSDAFAQRKEGSEVKKEEKPNGVGARQEGEVDISILGNVLSGLLSGSSLESLQLVPQLKTLRSDFASLEAEGFVSKDDPKIKPKRYGVTDQEEKEAEQCIHREALERSQRSVMNVSFADSTCFQDDNDDGDDVYGNSGYGDEVNDLSDGECYGNCSFQTNGTSARSVSQNNNPFTESYSRPSDKQTASTVVLLDALCSSDAFSRGGEYEYFSQASLEKISAGNQWAGSAHWKKSEKIRQRRANQSMVTSTEKRRKKSNPRLFLDFSMPSHHTIIELLSKGAPKKCKSDPLQITEAARRKQMKERSLLPLDAGIGIEHLSRLFMRPQATFFSPDVNIKKCRKSVGFHDAVHRVAFTDNNYSYSCDDDNGPAYELVDAVEGGDFGDYDYVVDDLEGVRKVERIEIGYATVAKKVDVRRLKKDLWTEVENKISAATKIVAVHEEQCENRQLSFREAVKELESSQSQTEVTVPFYFICILHLANEKGLKLCSDGQSLTDFSISLDDGSTITDGVLPRTSNTSTNKRLAQRAKKVSYEEQTESGSEYEDFEDEN